MSKLSYTFSVFPCGLGVMVVLLSTRVSHESESCLESHEYVPRKCAIAKQEIDIIVVVSGRWFDYTKTPRRAIGQ
eukprot:2427274-Amphidinium_carterae.1